MATLQDHECIFHRVGIWLNIIWHVYIIYIQRFRVLEMEVFYHWKWTTLKKRRNAGVTVTVWQYSTVVARTECTRRSRFTNLRKKRLETAWCLRGSTVTLKRARQQRTVLHHFDGRTVPVSVTVYNVKGPTHRYSCELVHCTCVTRQPSRICFFCGWWSMVRVLCVCSFN